MEVKSHILRLSGKAELPREIEIGHNFHVSLSGSVPSLSIHDNEDGTENRIYTFKPVKIELLDPLGETLKLKDTRTMSQLFRAQVWKAWNRRPEGLSADDFYNQLMANLISHAEEIVEMYWK